MRAQSLAAMLWFTAVPLGACRSGERAPTRAMPAPPATAKANTPAPVPAAPAAAAAAPAAEQHADEWEKVRLEDAAPLCVFANHLERGNALFIKDVHKQTLRAKERVVFGTFAPGCISEKCDGPPNHECSVERSGPNALVVHSHLSYTHKRGTSCSDDCQPVIAGCESDELAAGTYTVEYGTRRFKLRIPSRLARPCELK